MSPSSDLTGVMRDVPRAADIAFAEHMPGTPMRPGTSEQLLERQREEQWAQAWGVVAPTWQREVTELARIGKADEQSAHPEPLAELDAEEKTDHAVERQERL